MNYCLPLILLLVLAALAGRVDGADYTSAIFLISNASMTTMMTQDSVSAMTGGMPAFTVQAYAEDLSSTTVTVSTCLAGYYSPDDSQTCTACPAGKYSTTVTATSSLTCIACESGKYSGTVGAVSSATCINCPNGTYFDGTGGVSIGVCLACPSNSSSYPGSKLREACVCKPGFTGMNGGNCSACGTSVWCLYGQANPCPTNSRSLAMSSSLGDCRCQSSFFGDTTQGGADLTLCQVKHTLFTSFTRE